MLNFFNSSLDVLDNKSPLFFMKIEKIFKSRAVETGGRGGGGVSPPSTPNPLPQFLEKYIFFLCKIERHKIVTCELHVRL